MSMASRMIRRTYLMYLANAMMCGLFLLWFSDWTVVQALISAALLAGFCMMCYSEGGWNGERDCTLERSAQKRLQEGKQIDEEMKKQFFDKKRALVCFLAGSIPLCLLATANLIASPAYPPVVVEEAQTEQSDDPFYFNNDAYVETQQEQVDDPFFALRIITRVCFLPLLPLYTILERNQTLLYALFIPFSFVMPACTAIGYLQGPKIREKKIEEIARGKVRKKRGLLVGAGGTRERGPRTPKPKV